VSDLSDAALGTFERVAAIGSLLEHWCATWRVHLTDVEEAADLDQGVVFARVWEDGHRAGSDSHVQQRRGWVLVWVEDVISRATAYLDINRARTVVERLAESRG